MDQGRIDSIGRSQHGLITRAQALGAGMSDRTWCRRLATGQWREVHPGVAALPGAVAGTALRVRAATLAAGEAALASHVAAAWTWVSEPEPTVIDVTVAGRGRSPTLVGVRVHRPTLEADLHPSCRLGIPVTSPLRALVDLGATEGPAAVERFLERALVARLFTMAAARATLDRHARPGRAGAGPLRRVLDAWSLGDRPPDSVLEVRMADLLRRHGLPLAQFQRPVLVAGRRLRPDFTYPSARVIIEVVGWQDHGHRQAFEADPERAAVLTAAGWVVLTFTWLQVLRRPEFVADCVRATLAQRGAAA